MKLKLFMLSILAAGCGPGLRLGSATSAIPAVVGTSGLRVTGTGSNIDIGAFAGASPGVLSLNLPANSVLQCSEQPQTSWVEVDSNAGTITVSPAVGTAGESTTLLCRSCDGSDCSSPLSIGIQSIAPVVRFTGNAAPTSPALSRVVVTDPFASAGLCDPELGAVQIRVEGRPAAEATCNNDGTFSYDFTYGANDAPGSLALTAFTTDLGTAVDETGSRRRITVSQSNSPEQTTSLFIVPFAFPARTPVTVSSAAELAAEIASDPAALIILTDDIDLATEVGPTNNWTPSNMEIHLEGDGHTINGLHTSGALAGFGLSTISVFGRAGFSNVAFTNVTVAGTSRAGALMAFPSYASASNVTVTGAVSGDPGTSLSTGGLFGRVNSSASCVRCRFEGTVTGRTDVGGIVGYGRFFDIYQSSSEATVSGQSDVGGIAGEYEESLLAENLVLNSTITATTAHIGGIAGNVSDSDSDTQGIRDSYVANTTINGAGTNYAGGILGRGWEAKAYSQFFRNYSTADINATGTTIGRLFGSILTTPQQENSFYLGSSLCPNCDHAVGTSLNSTQLATEGSYTGWDFTNVWWMDTALGRPRLQWERE